MRGFIRDFTFVVKTTAGVFRAELPSIHDYLDYHATEESTDRKKNSNNRSYATYIYLTLTISPFILEVSIVGAFGLNRDLTWIWTAAAVLALLVISYGVRTTTLIVLLVKGKARLFRVVHWWIALILLGAQISAVAISVFYIINILTGALPFSARVLAVIHNTAITQGEMLLHKILAIKDILVGVLCLFVLMIGIRWQAATFLGDALTGQQRMKWALVIVLSCLSGATVWALFAIADKQTITIIHDSGTYVLVVGLIGLAFLIKTWLGPILLTSTLSWSIYSWFIHGDISLMPVFDIVIKRLLGTAPPFVSQIYVGLTLVTESF